MSIPGPYRALVFAAPPPPIGGVSSIVAMLRQSLAGTLGLGFSAPLSKDVGLVSAIRPIVNLLRLVKAALRTERGARVLFFSSAGASFYEKLAWLMLLRISGRHAVIVMVDGNFPAYWEAMPSVAKRIARALTCAAEVTIGVQSERWRLYYESILSGAQCVVISATVDREFRAALPWQDTASIPTVLYVGWMIPGKGVLDLLKAFQQVHSIFPHVRLRMIGPLLDADFQLQVEAQALGISASVDFVGPVHDRQALIDALRAATVFVLPSHAEGLPVALLEAMTIGVPCISSDVGGIPDLLDHGGAGIIVPPCDPGALAQALKVLLGDPIRRSQLSRQAAIRARDVYDAANFAASYLNILDL
jgi:glycosyltransferase involved in cell wall biosynthesis